MVIDNLQQDHAAAIIAKEYIESSNAWRLKLAEVHPHIHFGELARQMLMDKDMADAVMQEYLAFLEKINEEERKPDRADMYKDVSVPVATVLDGIKGSAEAKQVGVQTALSRTIAGTYVVQSGT